MPTAKKGKKPEGGEPPRKSIRSEASQPVVCLCCKRRPSPDLKWAETVAAKHAGVPPVPSGDRCSECHEVWQRGFSYFTWQHYATFAQTEVTISDDKRGFHNMGRAGS